MEEEKTLFNTKEGLDQYINMGVLALGISLPEESINKFIIYIKMIHAYQKKVNITSIQDTFDIINTHFLDSLSCIGIINNLWKTFQQGKRLKIIDVGSGAGFPGVPVKMVLSDASMCLLEARKNRILFLREVIDKLELTDTKVVRDRAENIGKAAEFREKYHIVLSRAVAALGVLCEYCLPLCQINGVMIAFKGSSYQEELSGNKEVIERLGGIMESINVVRIPHSSHLRYVLVIRKIKPTPERFPRKNGIPQKRPLYFK